MINKKQRLVHRGAQWRSAMRSFRFRRPRQQRMVEMPPANLPTHETLFNHIFESGFDGNLLVDTSGKILLVNQQAAIMFGYAKEELAGQPLYILIPEERRERYLKNQRGYLQTDQAAAGKTPQPVRLETEGRRKDGSRFPAETTLNPFNTPDGPLVLCVVRDISPRVNSQRMAQEKEELVRLLQDVAVAANETESIHVAFQFTVDRLIRYLNWPLGHAFLLEEDQALSSTQIWSGTVVDSLTDFRAASESIRFRPGVGLPGLVLETGQPSWMNNLDEQPNFARGNEARQVGLKTAMALPVIVNREVVGVLEFFHFEEIPLDPNLLAVLPHIGVQLGRVVERRRALEALRRTAAQLRMVMTNLPVILWLLDRTGRLILLEGKGIAALGVDPAELMGRNLFETLSLNSDLLANINRALQGEEVHTEMLSEHQETFEVYFIPYHDENWTIDGVIGLAFNISERKRLEAELEETKHSLLTSIDNERARLAAQLHDGPLQDLYGAFYQVQEIQAGLDEAGQQMVGRVLQTIQAVNATLQVISGELHPNTLVHLGLQRAMRSHAERAQERLDHTSIHLDLADDGLLNPPLPLKLRLGLYRVYQQLLNNAASHANAKHIWVRLRLLPEQIFLEVQDNGTGFELPEHWIELVRQGHFGLMSTLERVQSLGGKLEVDTHPGAGTLARVIIPRA